MESHTTFSCTLQKNYRILVLLNVTRSTSILPWLADVISTIFTDQGPQKNNVRPNGDSLAPGHKTIIPHAGNHASLKLQLIYFEADRLESRKEADAVSNISPVVEGRKGLVIGKSPLD